MREWLSAHPNPTGTQLAEAGLVAPHLPKPWGLGADADHQLIIDDELRRANVRLPINPIGIGWAGPTILYAGTKEQQNRWLPKLLSGEEFWCQLFSEPNAGSDLASLTTSAERDGDEWIISGQKVWTSYAHLATWGILLARTSNDVAPQKGISYFICPMNAPGVTIRPIIDITGDHAFNEVFLDEVRLPADYLIGEVNDGWRLAKVTLGNERVSLSGEGVLWGRGPTAADLVELVRTSGIAARRARARRTREVLVPRRDPATAATATRRRGPGRTRTGRRGQRAQGARRRPRSRGHDARQSSRRFGGHARGPRTGRRPTVPTAARGPSASSTRRPSRSAAARRRCSATSSANACSDCPRIPRPRRRPDLDVVDRQRRCGSHVKFLWAITKLTTPQMPSTMNGRSAARTAGQGDRVLHPAHDRFERADRTRRSTATGAADWARGRRR